VNIVIAFLRDHCTCSARLRDAEDLSDAAARALISATIWSSRKHARHRRRNAVNTLTALADRALQRPFGR
jgi:hypothetical protein